MKEKVTREMLLQRRSVKRNRPIFNYVKGKYNNSAVIVAYHGESKIMMLYIIYIYKAHS